MCSAIKETFKSDPSNCNQGLTVFSFFRKAETSSEGFDRYLADLTQMVDGVPASAQMSMVLFAAMDRAYNHGLSEDERTDVHVAGLCAYRDLCMLELLQMVNDRADLMRIGRNVARNMVEDNRQFWTLVKKWDLSHSPIVVP
jgi:hypothetical protein